MVAATAGGRPDGASARSTPIGGFVGGSGSARAGDGERPPGTPGATVSAEGGGSGRDRAGAAASKTAATRGKPHAAMGEPSA